MLEVGCNIGGNLRWIAELLGPENVAGVDLNEKALELLRERVPGVDARLARGRELPFEDASLRPRVHHGRARSTRTRETSSSR